MFRRTWVAAVLAAAGFVSLLLAAAPTERVPPDGIDGTLLLCGDRPTDRALDAFCDAAGNDKAQLVVLTDDAERVHRLVDALKARKPASVAVVKADAKEKELEPLEDATGAWVLAGMDSPAAKEFPAVMKRGVVALSGVAARGDVLPGAVVEPNFTGDILENLFATLDTKRDAFAVGVGQGTALLIHGRQMSVVGDGAATILLAKSTTRPRRVMEITEKTPSDYTMLRRAAVARAGAPFPPKEPVTPEVPKGSLVIVGGGGMPADVTKKFIELAGGTDAHIVVLPTANPGATGDEGGFFKKAGAKNVVSLPAVKLEDVEDPKNLEVLRKADAIWFGGGRQWHFVDAYEGTKAEELFRDVLRRGGAIGGSSAGATIQGDYLCRGSPLNNTDEMCEGYERGFGFLPGVGIDQHFTQRDRFADMTSLMKAYPQLLGIGLDEATAIVVRGHEAAVMGKGVAHFYDGGKPAAEGRPDYDSVKAGGRYDLKERKVLDAGGGR